MKNGKAGGLDKIIPELIKEFDDNLLGLIIIVLNNILIAVIFRKNGL